MTLAVLSVSLSVDLRMVWPRVETSEKRTLARCEHVMFCCGSDHCFCLRYFRVSIVFFTGPGVFSILILYCWSVGGVVGRFRDGGLSAVFFLGAGEEVVGSFDVVVGSLMRVLRPARVC